jgi:hypothetical protein
MGYGKNQWVTGHIPKTYFRGGAVEYVGGGHSLGFTLIVFFFIVKTHPIPSTSHRAPPKTGSSRELSPSTHPGTPRAALPFPIDISIRMCHTSTIGTKTGCRGTQEIIQ